MLSATSRRAAAGCETPSTAQRRARGDARGVVIGDSSLSATERAGEQSNPL